MALIGHISGSSRTNSVVGVTGSIIIANSPHASFPGFPGSDVSFFVDGTPAGSNKSVFGGDAVVSGSLTVENSLAINSLDVTDAITGSAGLKIDGDADFNSTANFQDAVVMQSTLNAGATTLSSLSVTSNATVGGNLTVTGDLEIQGETVTIDVSNLLIEDPLVGFGFASASVAGPLGDRGFIGGLTGENNVSMFWDESASEFSVVRTDSTSESSSVNIIEYSDFHANNIQANVVSASLGLSGSLTQLTDGSSYLIAGDNITITSASNGAITITGLAGDITSVVAGTGLTGGGSIGDVTLDVDDSVVATVSGSTFTGAVNFNQGLSGSLTQLTDGSSYLIAGNNTTITSASNGAITISSLGSGDLVAGSDTQVQFNDGGVFGASSDFTFDKANKNLFVTNAVLVNTSSQYDEGLSINKEWTSSTKSYRYGARIDAVLTGSNDLNPSGEGNLRGLYTRVTNKSLLGPATSMFGIFGTSRHQSTSSMSTMYGTRGDGIIDLPDDGNTAGHVNYAGGLVGQVGFSTNVNLTGSIGTAYGALIQSVGLSSSRTITNLYGAMISVGWSEGATNAIGLDITSVYASGTKLAIRTQDPIVVGTTNVAGSEKLRINGTSRFDDAGSFILGLSGSLTQLTDGSSYLIAGDNITITSASNGAITITGLAGDITSVTAGTGLTGGGSIGDVTLDVDDSVVATISGSTFTGAVNFNQGLSGSLTQLTDGSSYLIAGNNTTITSASNGAITISSLGSGDLVAGSDTQVQFNDGGVFGASSDFTFDKANKNLFVTNAVLVNTSSQYDEGLSINKEWTSSTLSSRYGAKIEAVLTGSNDLNPLGEKYIRGLGVNLKNKQLTAPNYAPIGIRAETIHQTSSSLSAGQIGVLSRMSIELPDDSNTAGHVGGNTAFWAQAGYNATTANRYTLTGSIGTAQGLYVSAGTTFDTTPERTIDNLYGVRVNYSNIGTGGVTNAVGLDITQLDSDAISGTKLAIRAQDPVVIGTTDVDGSEKLRVSGTSRFDDAGNFILGLSGSLTQLTDGSSYLIAGDNISITSASNGAITITGLAGDITSVTAGTGLTGGGSIGDVTLDIDDSVVATISGSQFQGTVGVTGSFGVSTLNILSGVLYQSNGVMKQSSTFVWDASNGRLGIGTNAPAKALHVGPGAGAGIRIGPNSSYIELVQANSETYRWVPGGTTTRIEQNVDHVFANIKKVGWNSGNLADIDVSLSRAGSGILSVSGSAPGAIFRFNDSSTPTATGDMGMNVSTGRPNAFIGGSARELAHTDEVALLAGSTFTGAVSFNQGLSGSLTQLTDGSSYLIAGNNISITSASNGSITITGLGSGELVAGSDTQIQFNDGGAFGGDPGMTYNKSTLTLSADTLTVTGSNGLAVTNNATISGRLNIVSSITGSSSLTLEGPAILNGGILADAGAFSVADTTGNVFTAGTLGVVSSITGSSTLTITGGSSLLGGTTTTTLTASDLASFNGDVDLGNAATDSITFVGRADSDFLPIADSTYNLGSATNRWANVYTGDLHLRNDRGDYTIIEEEDMLTIRFNKTGKRYKFLLERVADLDEDPAIEF